jgi:ZIP family zinc transporter
MLTAWRTPSERVTAGVQHLAAGIVLAATALELLPKERSEAKLPVIIGFALGLVLMLGLRWLADTIERRKAAAQWPTGLIMVTGMDLLIDGTVLGIAFATGEKAGVLLAAALTLEVLFLSLSVTAAVATAGGRRAAKLLVAPGLALLLCVSAVASRLLLGGLSAFSFAVLLGIGIVALMYLVVEELLVEAHEVDETPWAIAAFFVGFLMFLVIEMMVEP